MGKNSNRKEKRKKYTVINVGKTQWQWDLFYVTMAVLLLCSHLPYVDDQPFAVFSVVYRLGIHHCHFDARFIL